eukprot:3295_1
MSILIIIYIFAIHSLQADSTGWSLINAQAAFSVRASPHGVTANGIFILTGGRNGTDTMHNDVWRSNDQGKTWESVSLSAPWEARAYHFCVMLNNSLFVMGGQGGNGLFEFFDDIWRSDDLGKTWKLIVEHAPWGKRAGGYSFVYDNEIYLMAGAYCDPIDFPCNKQNGSRHYFDDVWKSNDGIHWQQISTGNSCMKREGIIVVEKDGNFYAFGGDNGFEGPYFNDVWQSTDKGNTWSEITLHAEWSERTGQVGVLLGKYLIVFGGFPDLTDMWRSIDGKIWELVTDNCWNCNKTDKNCGKFDFEFFVDDTTGQQRIYTIAGDQEVTQPFPQDNDVWFYANSSMN